MGTNEHAVSSFIGLLGKLWGILLFFYPKEKKNVSWLFQQPCHHDFFCGSNWLIQISFPHSPSTNKQFLWDIFLFEENYETYSSVNVSHGKLPPPRGELPKGASDRKQKHNTVVTSISNISANEKVHEQEHTPLNLNVLQIKTRLVTATQIRF